MSYQNCPKCKGTGKMLKKAHPDIQLQWYKTKCDICNGKKIIHTETGKAPKD